ncbi:MAG: toll/interleukin-1 receptor domain-containing protein [Cyanobacteria bacterium P01_F01_bin.13]
MAVTGSIFISYRRSDSITESGRVYDKLIAAFGPERVFKDVYDIPPGADFVTYLEDSVAQCDVLIPLIGQTWLTVTHPDGSRRLDDPNDFVRIEIASALANKRTLVLPLLLNGTMMPSTQDLPESLQSLTRRNAANARQDPDFHNDMERLIDKLKEYFVSQGIDKPEVQEAPDPVQPQPVAAAVAPAMPAGDSISANISGNMSGNIAVGKNISQTQNIGTLPEVTSEDKARLKQLLSTLTAQIEAEVPEERKEAALEHLEELEETITSDEPDLATMEYVVKWFKKKLPQLAVYVMGTLLNPVVGKVLEATGAVAPGELKQRFGK